MLSAVKGVVGKHWDDVKGYAERVFKNHLDTLKELAELRLNNEIDDAELKSELEDETKTVEAELLALKVLSKAISQKAANAAMRVFVKAVKTAARL